MIEQPHAFRIERVCTNEVFARQQRELRKGQRERESITLDAPGRYAIHIRRDAINGGTVGPDDTDQNDRCAAIRRGDIAADGQRIALTDYLVRIERQ